VFRVFEKAAAVCFSLISYWHRSIQSLNVTCEPRNNSGNFLRFVALSRLWWVRRDFAKPFLDTVSKGHKQQ